MKVWLVGEGRFVAWSGLDGAGGYDDEGQSLRLHDTASGKTHKVLAERFEIDRVSSQPLSDGRCAILVEMSDGAVDGDHFAVVNPERGEVFFAKLAVRLRLDGDSLTLGYLQGSESQLLQDMPVFTPVGRAGTIALLAYGAAKLGIAPKYTSAIARGMVNVAVYTLARRKFKFDDETEGKAMMSGADEALLLEGSGLQDEDMMGDVDEVGAVMEYDD